MGTSRLRLVLTALLCLVGWGLTHAARGSPAPASRSYSLEAGIPLLHNFAPADYAASPQNWAVVQDHRGIIYVGNSDDGVLEFDGNHWRRIPITNRSTVRSLAVGADNRVYVGGVGEFGYLAPDAQGRMRYVSLLDRIAPRYRDFADVWHIHLTGDGVYFGSAARVFRMNGARMDVWDPQTAFHLTFQVGDQVYAREIDRGLMKFSGDRLEPVAGGERFAKEKIYVMLPWGGDGADGRESILIGTRTQGWFIYDGSQFRAWPTDADAVLKREQIYTAQWLANGMLAVGTLQGGVTLLDRQGRIVQHLRRAEGLINDTVFSIFQDREQDLWLALDNGVTRLDVASPLSYFSQDAGLDGTVQAMQRQHGTLYVGTTKGLFRLQRAGNDNAHFVQIPGIQAQVWDFLDMGDTLLVATAQGVFEIDSGVAKPCTAGPCTTGQVAFTLLRSRQDDSRVFIGMRNGVASMRREHGRWIDEGVIAGTTGEIRSLADDASGHVWLGSLNHGAMRLTLPTGWPAGGAGPPRVESFQLPSSSAPANPNYAFLSRIDGVLRFVTARGIYLFDRANQRLVADASFADLFPQGSRRLSQLSEDAQGRVWMYTTDDTKTIRETGYAVPDANGNYHWDSRPLRTLSGVEVYAIDSEPDGVTWFSSSDGLYRYDPSVATPPVTPLPTLLRKVSDNTGRVLWGGAGATPPLTLEWQRNSLRFDYASPNSGRLPPNRFQVMLEGADTQWSTWSTETYRDYTNIHEGHYRFRVRARDANGTLSPEAVYHFRVLPPWYRTWWAYLAYLALAALAVALGIQLRSTVLRRHNSELVRLVELRTEELSASHQALQEANQALLKQSITDTLTGLKNRRYVLDHVAQDVATVQRNYQRLNAGPNDDAETGIDLLFLLIDIDHFKDVNDHYGHAAGDRVLEQIRDILLAATRDTDTPVRWGGEEFLVIARFASSEFGPIIAERIRRMMAEHPFDLGDGVTIHRTCSIGFATYPVLPSDTKRFNWEEVVRLADQCLYAAKHNGRNSWVGVRTTHKPIPDGYDPALLSAGLDVLVSEGYLRLLVSSST